MRAEAEVLEVGAEHVGLRVSRWGRLLPRAIQPSSRSLMRSNQLMCSPTLQLQTTFPPHTYRSLLHPLPARSTSPPLPLPQLDLLLALPRPRVLRRLLPVLAELGVGSVVLSGAERVEASYWGAKLLQADKVRTGEGGGGGGTA